MRGKIAKQLRAKALVIAQTIYKKAPPSVKINHTLPHKWQKYSPVWCYKQLKKAYKELRWKDKNTIGGTMDTALKIIK
jgi:hypothetical protein